MKTLIIGSAAALALVLLAGPVLTEPARAEAPNSVNVGGKNIGATRIQTCDSNSVAMSEARVSDCHQRPNCCCRGPRDVCFGRDSARC